MSTRLNYKHLHYFWVTAQEASLTRAAERLHLTPQTICSQIQTLEERMGIKLLRREGRGLSLTDKGKIVFDYADQIFSLGEELTEVINHHNTRQPRRFSVGITDFLPKLIAYRLIQPALLLADSYKLHCQEDRLENLITGLAAHKLDLILSDQPLAADTPVKAFSHLLGECGTSFFAAPSLKLRSTDFPRCLDGAPMLLATPHSAMRGRLTSWFERLDIHPQVIGEFDDSALMKVFGQAGTGILYAPSVIEKEVSRQYQLEVVGRTEEVQEHFYVISLERRLKHPAVTAIHNTARNALFPASPAPNAV